MIKPTFTGRRSKEERATLEKEAMEREKARTKELEAAGRRKQKDLERRLKRDADRAVRGRGGYTGAMSGPFSLGSSREGKHRLVHSNEIVLTNVVDRKANQRTTSGFGGGSGSRATRIKDEGEGGGGGGGGSGYGASGGSYIKREGGGFESSEDDEDAEFPRKNIDTIEISSDENEAAPIQRSQQRSTLPVRIGRKEHQEKSFGINTDASTETSAKILEQAEASGQAPTAAVLKQVSSKGKGKAKEADGTISKKPFKGVWQDSDVSPVKTEENSEDEQMASAEQIGIVEKPDQTPDQEEGPPTALSTAESKPSGRTKAISEPVMQTDEDRAEWRRFQNNLSHIRAELGPDAVDLSATVDASGDVNMAEGADKAKKPTVRDNNVYLFQIPPLMPELAAASIKKEPTEAPGPAALPPAPPGKSEVKIKVEEGFTDTAAGHEAPQFVSGAVGRIRVRQSGRTTLDWGGTSYELTPGNKASFLQEVVSVHVVPEKDRVVPEAGGEAVSFGRVKGKFVVVPDWNEMLG
jgi:DNA-directed RNA polymerase III subunit RPC4